MKVFWKFGSWVLIGLLLCTNLAVFASTTEVSGLRSGRLPSVTPVTSTYAVPQETRMPGHMEQIPAALYGQNGPWVAPRQDRSSLDLLPEVWVDDSYTPLTPGWGVDHFATIQNGINAVDPGGIVNVYPGTYNETAPGSILFDLSGPYEFGLFIGTAKSGITVRGVDAGGTPITNYASVAAEVIYTATNSFGTSGVFVEGDNVTINALSIHNAAAQAVNKTLEIIGDAFTMRYCKIDDWDLTWSYGGSTYFNDWRVNTAPDPDVSHVQSYTVEYNYFPRNNTIDIASGAGFTGPASGRLIRYNTFDSYNQVYSSVSFSGYTPAIGWYLFDVGGATITGNTLSNGSTQYIKARGGYDNSTFDWASYWNDNTFDKKVAVGVSPPGNLRAYAYDVFTNTRRIGTVIQGEIDNALAGDIVLVGPGTYPEWNILVNQAMTVQGAGVTSIIDATGHVPTGEETVISISAPTGNVTLDGFKIKTGQNDAIWATGNMNTSSVITISHNELEGFSANLDPSPGVNFGLISGYGQLAKVVFDYNVAHDFYSNVILCENQVGQTEVMHNTLSASFGIFYMTHDGYDVSALQKISQNSFNLGGLVPGWNSAGIAFESAYHTVGRTGTLGNVEITDNSLTSMVADRRGISLYNASLGSGTAGEIVAPVVKRNTVSGTGANTRGIQLIGLVSEVTHCDACLVYLAEPRTGDVVLRASQLPHSSEIGTLRLKMGEGVAGWVAEHRAPVVLSRGAFDDPRFKRFPSLVEDTYEALVSVPLVSGGEIIGVLNVHHKEPHAHTPGEIGLLTFLGEQMGGAIVRSRLSDENARLQQAADEMKQRLEDRTLVERAKGILQERFSLTEQQAYLRLRNESRRLRRPMRELAEAILLAEGLDPESLPKNPGDTPGSTC